MVFTKSYVFLITKMYNLMKYAEKMVEIFETEWNYIKFFIYFLMNFLYKTSETMILTRF